MTTKVLATINATGRQAASFIRAASAVGWQIRAQIRNREGLVAEELADLPNVEIVEGDLTSTRDRNRILNQLFTGAKIAFINTTHWGDEVAIGKACADAAKRAGVAHYVYSSMPDHSTFGEDWRALPMWATKFAVENYVRQIGIPATFIYTGIYNNNFTSLPYPLFQMELQQDGSFSWQAPFHPDDPLPWLDAEHDVGPALLQIFKMGPNHWKGQRYVQFSYRIRLILTITQSHACVREVDTASMLRSLRPWCGKTCELHPRTHQSPSAHPIRISRTTRDPPRDPGPKAGTVFRPRPRVPQGRPQHMGRLSRHRGVCA